MKLNTLCESAQEFAKAVADYLVANGIPSERVLIRWKDEVSVHDPNRQAHEPYIRFIFLDDGRVQGALWVQKTQDGWEIAQKRIRVSMFDPDSFPTILRFVKDHPQTYET